MRETTESVVETSRNVQSVAQGTKAVVQTKFVPAVKAAAPKVKGRRGVY